MIGLYATPEAFAEIYTIENVQGSSTPGCEPNCFSPSTLTISTGNTVIFENNDTAAHTTTSGTPADGFSGVWDSSLIMSGSSFVLPNLGLGEYPYFCLVHPWMMGQINVVSGGSSTPEPKLELQITRGTTLESQNNSSYLSGDTISVSGTATGKSSSTPVVITLFSPNDNIVDTRFLYTNSNGSYSITLGVGGTMWGQTGNYNVEATYGSLKESEKFYFTATIKIINAPGSSTPGCEPDCFIPSTLRVAVGDDIEFLNPDTAAHTTTSGTPGEGPNGMWDSGLVMPGSSYYVLVEPSDAGTTLPYFCMVHPWMTGKIIVEGSTSQSGSSQAQDDATERIAAAEAAVAKAEAAARIAEAEAAARIAEAEAAAKIAVSEAAVKAAEEAARAAEQTSEERIAAAAVNEKIEISMDFTNDSDVQQSFALIVQIKDSNNTTISLSHVTGMLGAGQTLDQVLSYTPTEAGTYTVEKFLWDNLADPAALTDSKETFSLTVS